ncbi:hypothetical protein HLH21_13410, partial [Gluconacetobacter johannae]|nr:hypothetical protein [Gluconacetobacter johannae]
MNNSVPSAPAAPLAARRAPGRSGDAVFSGVVRLSGWLILVLMGGLIGVLAWGGAQAWGA